eukprot:4385318-Prymnesium_polylepis.1
MCHACSRKVPSGRANLSYLALLPSYARVKESEIEALPLTLQLLARARYALFGVLVVEKGLGAKRKHTHVALDVSGEAYIRAAEI